MSRTLKPFRSSLIQSSARRLRRGFTLLEILVVLAIIGLLAGLAINNIGGILGGAEGTAAQIFVNQSAKTPLMTYRLHTGSFPSTADGLQALITAPASASGRWQGPYVEKIPLDPWKEPYQYAFPGKRNPGSYDVWSKGPDKQSDTADDIGNWGEAATAAAPK
ncbi:MAG TPA: type II secretion system major pseudopilin GspG [Opitutaceae bacterium]